MVVFRPAPPFADLRGSIGQTTYGRNHAGLFARNRTAPDDSDPSAEQLACRENLQEVAAAFAVLSDTKSRQWRALAAETVLPNALGDPYTPSAWTIYARLQMFLLFIGLSITTDVPEQVICPSSKFWFDYLGGAGKRIRYRGAGERAWAGYALFQKAFPFSLQRFYCKGPWNTGRDTVFSETELTTPPRTVVSTDLIVDNQAYFIRERHVDAATGGLSIPAIYRVTTTV